MNGPHDLSPIYSAGEPVKEAAGAVVLLHGRGSNAGDILGLSRAFGGLNLAFIAPQAAGNAWYPQRFIAPREENEPYLSSALEKVKRVVDGLVGSGIPTEKIVIAGFSQGACLASEFVASNPARYAALIAFTGGLIGPLGSDLRHEGDLKGTPALFLSGDTDPHIPFVRVEESVAELTRMGAQVQLQRYPGKPHNVSADELERASILLQSAFSQKYAVNGSGGRVMQTMDESVVDEQSFTSAASLWLVMMKAYRSMEAYIESTVSAQGIGLSDFMILEALMHKGPMSMSQIGEKVLLANPSMTAAVDRLEKLGYVSRCSGASDKRVRTVDLTKEGRKVIRRIFAQHEQDLEEVMSGVCATMRGPVREALKRIGLAAKAKTEAKP